MAHTIPPTDPAQLDAVRARVKLAAERLAAGKMVIMVDDEDRENEGDLTIAAQFATPESINFMAKHGRGLICLSLDGALIDKLDLPLMVSDRNNHSRFGTGFTVSIEAAIGVTTGISAHDRSHTILTAVKDDAKPTDLVRPGHIFPLRARDGGVLVRSGQTEGSVDLAKIAKLKPAAVICEVMNDDGTMARRPQLEIISKEFDIPIVSVADIISYRLDSESLIDLVAESVLPTRAGGEFAIRVYRNRIDGLEHVALIKGDITKKKPVLVRVHSECLTGDALGSLRCDCGSQLESALAMIEKEGSGVLLYLRQEGRGIGLGNKIKAYHLQDGGMDTVEANIALGFAPDIRDFGIGAQILKVLGISDIRLITNNPKKLISLSGYGLRIVEQVPTRAGVTALNERYLRTKQEKLGHTIFTNDTPQGGRS